MNTFSITEGYGAYCNECGKQKPGQVINQITVNGVQYTLCDDCFRRFIGTLYNAKPKIFEELIKTLANKDRQGILAIING